MHACLVSVDSPDLGNSIRPGIAAQPGGSATGGSESASSEEACSARQAEEGRAWRSDLPRFAQPYHAAGNQFERFRGFLELISRFEFEFCRRENYFF